MKEMFIFTAVILSLVHVKAQDWQEIEKLVASDRSVLAYFGTSVSINGDYAIVGAEIGGVNPVSRAGAAYFFEKNGNGNWVQVQKTVPSDREAADLFGNSVAISGNYAIVGAYHEGEDSFGNRTEAGSAYIFERMPNGTWNQTQKLTASDGELEDNFGYVVSISGNYAMVATPNEDHDESGGDSLRNSGSAYIFERGENGNWNELQKIVASDRGKDDEFGKSIHIDGDIAIIGAWRDRENAAGTDTLDSGGGSAYIFERESTGIWIEKQKITASDRESADHFGEAVSISGNYAIVGADAADYYVFGGDQKINSGAVYVYEKNINTNNWEEVQIIQAIDKDEFDYFGCSVSINGNYLVVGAEEEDSEGNAIEDAGAAYIYEKDSIGQWIYVQKITSSNQNIKGFFGWSVSLSDEYILVGAFSEETDASGGNPLNKAGAAYIFSTSELMSIAKNELSPQLNFYPNPTAGPLTIELGRHFQEVKVNLRNLIGQIVSSQTYLATDKIQFEIQGRPGIYLMEVQTSMETSALFKIIKD